MFVHAWCYYAKIKPLLFLSWFDSIYIQTIIACLCWIWHMLCNIVIKTLILMHLLYQPLYDQLL